MIIKKIAVLRLGYVLAIIFAIFGFFQGLSIVFQLKTSLVTYMDKLALPILTKFNYWLILLCPAFMMIMGFLIGIVAAVIYNWIVVRMTGGIKLTVE